MPKRRVKQPAEAWVSSKVVAESLGVTIGSVTRGANSGRIDGTAARRKPSNNRWEFLLSKVEAQWYANIDASRLGPSNTGSKTIEEIQAIQAKHGIDGSTNALEGIKGNISDAELQKLRDEVSQMTGTEAKVAADRIKILKGEIELAQLMNDLLRRDVVYEMLYVYGQRIRQRFEEVPARIIDDVLAADGRIEGMGIIRDSLDKVLLELTDIPELKNPE